MGTTSYSQQCKLQDDGLFAQVIREISESGQAERWRIEFATGPNNQWIKFSDDAVAVPTQGWKLHITADLSSAETVLRRVLPILLAEATDFKVAASLQKLLYLNQGDGGGSQIGKFITIYPQDDQEAVRLAVKLDQATAGLSGPNVPSDRALHPGSLVFYRYGNFTCCEYTQTPIGTIEIALRTPDNRLVPDIRLPRYEQPSWACDPFMAAGVAVAVAVPTRFIGNRYLIISTISASINHIIQLGADLEKGRSCIIKGPGYAWRNNASASSEHESLQHEAHILTELAPHPRIPEVFAVIKQDYNTYLIMQDIEGKTLINYVNDLRIQCRNISIEQIIAWGQELATIFEAIHAKGIVYADLKASNVIVDSDQKLYLIDFELAHKQGHDDRRLRGRGTRGYMSPQQANGQETTIFDDMYSFGSLLYFMLTGSEVSVMPELRVLLSRPIEDLRPQVRATLKEIIVRCLQEEPEKRYASMSELKIALMLAEKSTLSLVRERECDGTREIQARGHYDYLSRELMETLCVEAKPAKEGWVWISTHQLSRGIPCGDINTGSGGTVLALAELVAMHREPEARTVLVGGARWLRTMSLPGFTPLPGLYVGESGTGAALLRAGQVLQDEILIEAALERGRHIASRSHTSPDLFNGSAGRLRFHLLLWDETGEREHLEAAIACGKHLLATCLVKGHNEMYWMIPPGYGSLSDQRILGYAHGAAGIADTLLDLFEVTGDEHLLEVVQGVGHWLQVQAIPSLDDESGLSWPQAESMPLTSPCWCHGATGIGRFFLHAGKMNVISDAMDIARRAARTVEYGVWVGSTQCHGLAGNIDFLLDMYQATGEYSYLTDAFRLGRLLESYAVKRDGNLVFSSETPDTFTPDYMVGYAGIALCLLRLSAPEHLPSQLSRAGFRSHQCSKGLSTLSVENLTQGALSTVMSSL